MQQLIRLTDTAFLVRVGEVELGASAVASMYYLAIYMPEGIIATKLVSWSNLCYFAIFL